MAKEPTDLPSLEPLIFSIRGHRVILDADLARLYGVHTKRFNEAFKRNRGRFPDDFAFQISDAEYPQLRAQLANSTGQSSNWSQFATSSASRREAPCRRCRRHCPDPRGAWSSLKRSDLRALSGRPGRR